MLVYGDATIVGTVGGGRLEQLVIEAALDVIDSGSPTRVAGDLMRDWGMCCGGQMEVYVEPLEVREPFVLFGAGHVAHALAPLLVQLDYAVTVVDDRDELATAERFEGCEIRCVDARTFASELVDNPRAHWLVVTHDHKLDQDLVEILLPKRCAWMGMLGSRAKVARFLVRLRAAGMDEGLFRKLCAPVGLDIAAETPAEIAVSVAAEVIRVRRRSAGPPLPLSEEPLKARGGDGRAVAPALDVPVAPFAEAVEG